MEHLQDQFLKDTIDIVERICLERDLNRASGIQDKIAHSDLEEVIAEQQDEAENLANMEEIKSRICAGMPTAIDNLKDVTKTVAGPLLALSIAGSITVSLTPILVAAVVLIILDSGVAVYCKDHKVK